MNPETYEDLPVLTAKEVSKYFNPEVQAADIPKRYLMEAEEFLKHFNSRNGGLLKPEYCITRRALQFYSSPQVQILPLPVYHNRHTAHYIVPEHFNRLAAITALREKHFMPIKLIRKLLNVLPEEKYELLERWPGTVHDLVDAAPLFEPGFKDEDMLYFLALKALLWPSSRGIYRDSLEGFGTWAEPHLKQFLLDQIQKKGEKLVDWIASNRGVRYVAALGKSVGGYSTPEEHLEKMIGRTRFVERALKELEDERVDYPKDEETSVSS
jgi:hypothetical protein